MINQVVVPDFPVSVGLNLINPKPVAPPLFKVEAQLRFLRGSAQQKVFHALAPGSQVLEGWADNLEAQFVQTDSHSIFFFLWLF